MFVDPSTIANANDLKTFLRRPGNGAPIEILSRNPVTIDDRGVTFHFRTERDLEIGEDFIVRQNAAIAPGSAAGWLTLKTPALAHNKHVFYLIKFLSEIRALSNDFAQEAGHYAKHVNVIKDFADHLEQSRGFVRSLTEEEVTAVATIMAQLKICADILGHKGTEARQVKFHNILDEEKFVDFATAALRQLNSKGR